MKNKKKPRCYNCKFAGQQFKIKKLTHLHCEDPKEYTQEKFDNNKFTAWDTLRVFNETCNNHEFKTILINYNKQLKHSIRTILNKKILKFINLKHNKMNNPLLDAVVISKGKKIKVYQLTHSNETGYCDYEDCKTVYKKEELRFSK